MNLLNTTNESIGPTVNGQTDIISTQITLGPNSVGGVHAPSRGRTKSIGGSAWRNGVHYRSV